MRERHGRANYLLRVHIVAANPQIWRRLVVPSDTTLDRLHLILQGAMGWSDLQPHSFEAASSRGEAEIRLCEVLAGPGDRMHYLYHPGDAWLHTIRLEQVSALSGSPRLNQPRCCGGRGPCPVEDIGGVRVWNTVAAALNGQNPAARAEREIAEAVRAAAPPRRFSAAEATSRIRERL